MNQELFDSMQKQMTPSPEVRAALSEKLAQPAQKRPVPWMKYGAVAACAALVIGAFPLYQAMKGPDSIYTQEILWTHRAGVPLHSYVTVEGVTGTLAENAAATENTMTGGGDTGFNTGDLPNRDTAPSGALPGGAYIGDVPVQEGAEDYQKLMDHFNGTYPDWYGGAYLDSSGWLVVQLVEDKDPADKSLELQVLDWTGSDNVMFSSCTYSLSYLRDLQDKVCDAMIELDLFSSCGTDEELNRLDLTLTSVTDEALALLAELDPDDDAIYVKVGQRASVDSAKAEDPAVHHVVPGGTAVPEDEDLIAVEPYYDGVLYDVENLPEQLPQEKQPAANVNSTPEEDVSTASWFPED